jgi:DNA-binding NtrC family response regulator
MVVDDEYDVLYIVRKHLERWGFEVDTFSDPHHAFQVFKQNQDRYSVVLTDIRMPEMSGITLAAMMKKVKPDCKMVIMTAFEIFAEELRDSLPDITQHDILQKPFTQTQVCNAVKKHLHNRLD